MTTVGAIRQVTFELLPHPPHSPEITPSHYPIFGPLKETLSRQRFARHAEVKDVASVTTENFLLAWDQRACELLHNMCG